eukprot:jgi/Botrbrau1/18696/Bobra.0386s0022.1
MSSRVPWFFKLKLLYISIICVTNPSRSLQSLVLQVLEDPTGETRKAGRSLSLVSKGDSKALDPYVARALNSYLSNDALAEHMHDFAKRCKNISRIFSIGKSAKGLDLWALEISSMPGHLEAKPNVKYVANMHGDEPTGRQLLLALAEWLCAAKDSDPRAERYIRDMHLYLLPTLNPDGFAGHMRENAAGKDLNRDFPDPIERGSKGLQPSSGTQPEAAAVMAWALETHFVSSASLHEGAIVANYPYDGSLDRRTHYSACPDDATFVHLAQIYASQHATMHSSAEFKGGITNGAQWYPVYGGMQDWMYLEAKCLEITLELSQNKWPPVENLPGLFQDNLPALLAFHTAAAFSGVRGFVREAGREGEGAGPLPASVEVVGINFSIPASAQFGDFYRPLAPGRWTLRASMPGYRSEEVAVQVPEDGQGAVHNFTLHKLASTASVEEAAATVDKLPSLPRPLAGNHSPMLTSPLREGLFNYGSNLSKLFQSTLLIGVGLVVIHLVRTQLRLASSR